MQENFDAIILGGGINGCAIVRKLSWEGKRVCLLERHTVGCGTSSNSSKLIHGGLRYLETFLGIRPLVIDKHDETDATSMSRDYKIDVIRKGETRLIHVYGGKLTTCLSMAEKVAARL